MREYYIDLGYKDVRRGMYQSFHYYEQDIPRCRHGAQLVHNITFICHLALYHHTLYMKFGRAEALARFMSVSNWILENGQNGTSSFEFPYQYP